MKMIKMAMVAVMSCMLACGPAWATLTATVTPGYQFGSTERPTYSTLNLLGEPTVLISGTVDGSTGLTAGSVAGNLLADSVPDGITLNYNGSAPRQLEILPGGVGWEQVFTNVAGRGLSGGFNQQSQTGTNLNVNVDGVTIQLNTNNALTIPASFLAGVFFAFPATPTFTNIWGYAQTFLITNFNITVPTNLWFYTTNTWMTTTLITTNSTAQALTNTDTMGVQSVLQGKTNTVTTLGSLAGFVQAQVQQNAGTFTNLTRQLPTGAGQVPWYYGGSTVAAANLTANNTITQIYANTNRAYAQLVDIGGTYTTVGNGGGSGTYTIYFADPNTNILQQISQSSLNNSGTTFPINRFIVPPHYGFYIIGNGGASTVGYTLNLLATPY